MSLGRLLHNHPEHADHGGTIDHSRACEVTAAIGFVGRRRRIYTRLAALSGTRPGDKVLDVGCGTGYLTRLLARAAAPDGHATGVDPSPSMVAYARKGPGACSYVVGEGQRLDFADASFDVVASSLAFHHIPVEGRPVTLGEMFRVLRPGGSMLIAEFRPPTSRLGRRLVGALAGPAMQYEPDTLIKEQIPGAGFHLEATGRLRPMLVYVKAARRA